jgi:hypothetical protein
MFVQPRPKKSLLPPPSKKRKAVHSIDEIAFDSKARTEYLTGFHKRKQQRIKNAQEQAALKEKRERMEMRREVRPSHERRRHSKPDEGGNPFVLPACSRILLALKLTFRPIDSRAEETPTRRAHTNRQRRATKS